MALLRLFVAVWVGPQVAGPVGDWGETLAAAEPAARRVKPQNLHFTLSFLGDSEESLVEPIMQAVTPVAALQPPFELEVAGTGCFPPRGRPRVVWAGVGRGARELCGLAADVGSALAPLGLEAGGREFRPHLSVARVRPYAGDELQRLVQAASQRLWGGQVVDRVLLVSSVLGRGGPSYSTRGEARLGSSS